MAERSLRLRLGLFVTMTFVALGALVVLFGRTPSVFKIRAEYTVLFPEAPGIGIGTPVRKSGVRIGEVTEMTLDEQTGQVQVGIAVDRKYPPRTTEDVTISRGIFSGDTTLDIVPQVDRDGVPLPPREPYTPGSVILGVPPISARTLLGQAQSVIPTAQDSLVRLSNSMQRFEKAAPKIERAIDEIGNLAESIRLFVPELRETNRAVQSLIGQSDVPAREVAIVAGQPPEVAPRPVPADQATIRDVVRELSALLRSLQPAAEELRSVIKDSGPDLKQGVENFRLATDRAADLLNDENRKNVATTAKNLQTASADLISTIRLIGLTADQAEKTLKEFNARIVQSGKTIEYLEKATQPLGELGPQVAADVRKTAANLAVASEQLTTTFADLSRTLQLINRQDGTLQKVLSDPSLYNNLNASGASLTRLLLRLERVSQDLEVFADKVARRPEVIGIGGALNPSAGLKASPTAPLPETPTGPLPPTPGSTMMPPASQPPLTPIPPVSTVPVYRPAPDRPPIPPQR